jgi:anti-sigma factor RsiW
MKPHDDDELMLHADGELDERRARELEDFLAKHDDARGKVAAIGELGELVRGHLELSADALPDAKLAAAWREIEKRLDGEAAPAPIKERETAPHRNGWWRRASSFFDRFRGHIITGVVSAGAVAALALVLAPGHDRNTSSERDRDQPIDVRPAAFRPTQIEALDTPGGSPNVFHIQDEDGAATVIWVTPADTVEGI